MASLWSYVTRLTSRRHQASQQSLPPPDTVGGEEAETARAAEAVTDHPVSLSQPPLAGVIAEDRVEPASAIELPAALVAEQATDAAYPAVIAIAGGDSVAAPPEPDAVADDAASVSQPALIDVTAGDIGEPTTAVERPDGVVAEQARDAAYSAAIAAGDGFAVSPEPEAAAPASKARAPRRQNNRAEQADAGRKRANPLEVTPQAISLNDEIKLLRRALVGKLKLQNAQLKAMLERFKP
ncbi:hypothetical protein [Agrobacterium tumefaciens]|uniref:Uncharacterized protein n=1 Tax=Agrobacterium tumefaciens TaxID=358 RepID=A0AA44F769_AGRTU|nr:hypothetical protein [Agrobacterium tumefaciens]NTB87700.1 hypothetical protein [Agrobacterium tumefaciens]NTC17467.1 hypothetical protein [Agrobacterium tumefaciens]NTC29751.1 hypothetical protein [Agrobacterium tumefaciens]